MDNSPDNEEMTFVLACYIVIMAGYMYIRKKVELQRQQRDRKRRACWVSYINAKRPKFGAYNSTMTQLEVSKSNEWRNYMRMNKHLFTALLQSINEHISKQDTHLRLAIPPGERLALILRYVTTGESYKSLHYQFRMGTSTISIIVPDVCKAIFTCLKDQYLKTPMSADEWKKISKEYFDLWNFPHCLGSLDGKHIVLRKPWHAGSAFHNYKGTESIVLMAIVDANYKFTYIHVGMNGRISDGGVFKHTTFFRALESGRLSIPQPEPLAGINRSMPYVLVADDAFSLSKNLMKPYPRRNLCREQAIYN